MDTKRVYEIIVSNDRDAFAGLLSGVKHESIRRQMLGAVCNSGSVPLLRIALAMSNRSIGYTPADYVMTMVKSVDMAKEAERLGASFTCDGIIRNAVHASDAIKLLDFFIDRGVPVNHLDIDEAILCDKPEILHYLLSKVCYAVDKEALLSSAVERMRPKCVHWLMVEMEVPFKPEQFPLLLAMGEIELARGEVSGLRVTDPEILTRALKYLVEYFSDGKLKGVNARARMLEFVRLLILYGAKVSAVSPCAIKDPVVFKDFFKTGDDLDGVSEAELLMCAKFFITMGDLEMLKYLVRIGMKPTMSLMNTATATVVGRILFHRGQLHGQLHIMYYLERCHGLVPSQKYPIDIERYQRYVELMDRTRNRAAKTIQKWWVPICYDHRRPVGMRMFWRNYEDSCRVAGWDIPTEEEKRETEANFHRQFVNVY